MSRKEKVKYYEEGEVSDSESSDWETESTLGMGADAGLEVGRMDGKVSAEVDASLDWTRNDLPNEEYLEYEIETEIEANDFLSQGTSFEANYSRENAMFNPPDSDEYYQPEGFEQSVDFDLEYLTENEFKYGVDFSHDYEISQNYYKKSKEYENRASVDLRIPLTQDADKRNHALNLSLIGKRKLDDSYRTDREAAYFYKRDALAAYAGIDLDLHDDFSLVFGTYGAYNLVTGSAEYQMPWLNGDVSLNYSPGKFSTGANYSIGRGWANATYNDLSYQGISDEELVEIPTQRNNVETNGSVWASYSPRDFINFSGNVYAGYERSDTYEVGTSSWMGGSVSAGMRLSQIRHADWLYVYSWYSQSQGGYENYLETTYTNEYDGYGAGMGYSRRF